MNLDDFVRAWAIALITEHMKAPLCHGPWSTLRCYLRIDRREDWGDAMVRRLR